MAFSPDPTLQKVQLKNYDMVLAVTQLSINETMGTYLYAHPTEFAIYGIANEDGKVTKLTTDPLKSNCSLTGTLNLEKDSNGKFINLVDLSTSKGNQTVQYNITMTNGEFKFDAAGLKYEKKQDSNVSWIFKMFVDMGLQKIQKSDLPANLKTKLSSIDENLFSIQQLYLDMNTAALNTIEGVVFPALVQTPAIQLLTLYLIQQQTSKKTLFGVTVTYNNKSVPPPTFAPTYVDFCITPYTDDSGNRSNPNLDTLNYLVMVNNHAPPQTLPSSFKFNWVTDEQINGVMAFKQDQSTTFFTKQLNTILKQLCPKMVCTAKNDIPSIKLNPGDNHSLNKTFNVTNGQIGSYDYSSKDNGQGSTFGSYSVSTFGRYTMTLAVYLNQNTVQLKGWVAAEATITTMYGPMPGQPVGRTELSIMPNTTYNWSVDLQLYFDAQNNGQLDLLITNPNFSAKPVVVEHNKSAWEKFQESQAGISFIQNIGDLRGSLSTEIEGEIKANIESQLGKTNHFIFPGANSFAFKNPQFSASKDLVSNITYLNPNS